MSSISFDLKTFCTLREISNDLLKFVNIIIMFKVMFKIG
jgi:hypothetical protein